MHWSTISDQVKITLTFTLLASVDAPLVQRLQGQRLQRRQSIHEEHNSAIADYLLALPVAEASMQIWPAISIMSKLYNPRNITVISLKIVRFTQLKPSSSSVSISLDRSSFRMCHVNVQFFFKIAQVLHRQRLASTLVGHQSVSLNLQPGQIHRKALVNFPAARTSLNPLLTESLLSHKLVSRFDFTVPVKSLRQKSPCHHQQHTVSGSVHLSHPPALARHSSGGKASGSGPGSKAISFEAEASQIPSELVSGPFPGSCKPPELVTSHFFGDLYWGIYLAIVNKEAPPYVLRQYRVKCHQFRAPRCREKRGLTRT